MKFHWMAVFGLIALLVLAACGPAATTAAPTPSAEPTQPPSPVPPTEAPTATLAPTMTTAPGAATPAAGTPAADAPTTPGGAAATSAPLPTAAGGAAPGTRGPEQYTYMGQDIPDGSQFLPNRTVTITWTIKNTGTIGWTKEYALRHFAGPKAAEDVYFFSKDVPVNDTLNLIVTFTTPADPGSYDMWFKLTNNAGQNFGDLNLVYTVSTSPAKGTSTPTQ